ncbi:hypothetical protein NDU88_007037, partial [Pleurodeles waltl]
RGTPAVCWYRRQVSSRQRQQGQSPDIRASTRDVRGTAERECTVLSPQIRVLNPEETQRGQRRQRRRDPTSEHPQETTEAQQRERECTVFSLQIRVLNPEETRGTEETRPDIRAATGGLRAAGLDTLSPPSSETAQTAGAPVLGCPPESLLHPP